MVKWFLLHAWQAKWRSPYWQKSLGVNILLGLLGAYLALNFLALGYFLDVILIDAFPEGEPFNIFNQFVIYYLLVDLLMRFFLQEFPVMDLQRYLLLPLRKSKLFHFLLLKSIPTFFNVLPLFFVLPFFIKVVYPGYAPATAGAWLVLMLALIGTNNFIAFYLKKNFSIRPLSSILLLVLMAGVAFLDWKEILPLSEGFAGSVAALLQQPLLLIFPLGILALVYGFLYNVFRRYAYLDSMAARRPQVAESGQNFAVLDRFGKLGQLIQLDLHLIRRNKRPRTMIMMAVILLGYPLLFTDLLDQMGWMIFLGVFVTGMSMATYGQFMLSWESSFFDLLMGRNFSMRDYYEAKFFLFLGFNSIALLLCMVYVFLDWRLPVVFAALALYNIGVNSFVTMFFSTYNTKRIDPERQAFFNYQGVGATQFLYTVPLVLGPILIYAPFGVLGYSLLGLGMIGLLGITGMIFKNQLIKIIVRQFKSRKYIISSGFKQPA